MKYKILAASMLSVMLLSCRGDSGYELSMTIADPDREERFLNILDDKNVTYRITQDGQIFYPVEQSGEIDSAMEDIFGPIDTSTKGASVKAEDAAEIASKLSTLGINYEVFHLPEKAVFTWGRGVDDEATEVVREVVRARETLEK